MIGLVDSFILASAKLRAKRFLLVSTIIVSGLLFAALFAAIVIFSGVTKSVNDFTRMALNSEYLVKSTPVIPQSASVPSRINPSDEVIKELNTLQVSYVASQKALATQLKIPFDPNTITQILIPDPYANKSLPESSRVMINTDSPVFQQYLKELQQNYAKIAKNKLSDLQLVANHYNASAYHHNIDASTSFQTMTYLKNGKEDISWLSQSSPSNTDLSVDGYLTSSIANSQYSFVDNSFIQRFILPANNDKRRAQVATTIPVIITTKEAVSLFGSQLGLVPKPTGAAQQVAWMKNLQQKLNGMSYSTCYRNQADNGATTKAAQILTDIETNKDNKAYIAPSLIYNLPTEPCGGLTIAKDTRTTAEKDQAVQQDVVSKALGTYQQPVHQLIHFQIVGVMPTSPATSTTTDIPSFISGLLGAEYGAGAIIPTEMYNALPANIQYKNLIQDDSSNLYNMDVLQKAGIGEEIVTFKTLDDARAFIKNEGCAPTVDNCNKPFILEPYGTNYLLTDNLQSAIKIILQYAFVGVIGIAIVIVWFMMSRVIADGRRETAVFRALGAKRSDIVCIYLIYSSGVAFRIILFAILAGSMAALLVQSLFESSITDYARASYGVFDQSNMFDLISFNSLLLPCLVLCILAVGLVAVLPSLIRNVRRNPINDMRDE